MNTYFENNLKRGEEIVIEIEHSKMLILQELFKFLIYLIIAVVATIIVIKLIPKDFYIVNGIILTVSWGCFIYWGIVLRVITLLRIFCSKLALTNRRIIGKCGVLRIVSIDFPIEKVDNVSIRIPFWGRIFNYSSIMVKGTSFGSAILFGGVTNANEFRNALTAAIAKNADEARKAQADDIANAMKGNN